MTDYKQTDQRYRTMNTYTEKFHHLATLGMMASSISHDFNNILTAILGDTELAIRELPPESSVTKKLRSIESSVKQGIRLTKQILNYAKSEGSIFERLDLNSLLSELGHLLEISISKNSVISFDLSPNAPIIDGNPTQILQIAMNLAINASEAIGDQCGEISIRTGIQECDHGYLAGNALNTEMPEGKYSYFEVSDTGCGMDDATVTKIFNPFFTTKSGGNGLGLASAIRIMHEHKGFITVSSETNKGSVIRVLFPQKKVE